MTLKTPDLTGTSPTVQKVLHLMHQWQDDPSNYDYETWPKLKQALDEDRLSVRKLFNE